MELVGNCHGAVIELVRNWQRASVVLLIHQFQTTYMPAWMLSYYVQTSGRIYEMVLAEIKQINTAP